MNKKTIIKAVVLPVVFLASLFGFSMLTHTENVNLVSEMPESTLPVVSLSYENKEINELYGYKDEIDVASTRDTITPLSDTLVLPVTIHAFDSYVESISYQVRTLDMERLLEDTQVSEFSQQDGEIVTQFQIQNLLEEEQEYMLIITLTCGGEEIHYYTRIIKAPDWNVGEAIEFALQFHETTFQPENVSSLSTYMEPSSEGDNTTLQKVTIHSSMSQLAWGDFEGEVLADPVPSVKDIGSASNTVVLNYMMAATGENGETEFYNVEEYFRLRYSAQNERMYLLDYERTMNELFRGSGDNLTEDGLLLGIRDTEVDYLANKDGTIVSFVQEGDLWSYNSNTNQLSLIYSFRGIEGTDSRNNNPNYDIRIVKMDDSGSVDFVVYGYMNRGTYEGRVGIGLYHYDRTANTVEERLFVQADQAYEMLKETWGTLFYVSGDDCFYMIAGEDLYRISLAEGEAEVLKSGLTEGSFSVSLDGRYIAWQEEGRENVLTVTDLESEEQWQTTGAAGERLLPVGFVESDFVYGISREADTSASTGDLIYKIVIMSQEQETVKEYERTGYYITNAYVEDSTVVLERVWQQGDSYTSVEPDTIKSQEIAAARNVTVETFSEGAKQTQVTLTLSRQLSEKTPQVLTPKEVQAEEKLVVTLETAPIENRYYVYARGRIVYSTDEVTEAIKTADDWSGAVIAENQRYIWRRGRDSSMSVAGEVLLGTETLSGVTGSMERCLAALLQKEGLSFDVSGRLAAGASPAEVLGEAMPEADIFNLTGLTVSEILYYVNQGNPVLALGEGGEPLLIVGYDALNVVLYYPQTNDTSRMGLNDSEDYFAAAGSVFVGYLKK